ncbi:MAG: lipoyl domain-containing protein [Acidimicrobiaceae bacterium]|nr:lipoyl domain-containing protein [Acidimicrobiaceae bacterium]MDE0515641.1 lipoyl domain-containing protein [Acidimicrobiaceae bacterium]MDE0655185.1 lipoyl domain-containing protein [Acidimicrobiaceae bacterium]
MATSEEGAAPAGAELTIPQMGVVEQVLVVEWLVEDGSQVTAGEPVVVIDTDKAETELEAPASGRLHVLVPAGDEEVAVGTVLATVSTG